MKNFKIIEQALKMIGLTKPNCLFIAADVKTDYLHFAEVDYEDDNIEKLEPELKKLGVVFIPKYETLAIERETLWDNEK